MTPGKKANCIAAPSTQPVPEPPFRSHANPDGLLHVIKGRSYVEPISGRSPPLSLQQGINGLVGMKNACKGDIEDLKKHLGLVMPSSNSIISTQRFVLASKDLGWLCCEIPMPKPETKKDDTEIIRTISSGKSIQIRVESPDKTDAIIDRLYPTKDYLVNRRKQGQCYSMMMKAHCQKKLFYAELVRATRVAAKTTFIRSRQEARLAAKSRDFQRYQLRDEALLHAVKEHIEGVRKQSYLQAVLRARSMASRKSEGRPKSDTESQYVDDVDPARVLTQKLQHRTNKHLQALLCVLFSSLLLFHYFV